MPIPWAPLAIAGGGWLFNKLFGKKPQAPDMNAPQYQMNTDAFLKSGRTAIKDQTTQWLENAMRGYRGGEARRGWNPQTSGGGVEFGDRASGIASQNMSTAIANLESQAAQMKSQGMRQYGQDYQTWLGATQGQSGQYLGSLMQLLGQLDWGGGGSTPTSGVV